MKSAIVKRLTQLRVTLIWASGLLVVFTLGILWLGSLGLATFLIYRAHGRDEVGGYVVLFGFVLVVLGFAFVRFVNRFYDWHSSQQLNSILNELDSFQPEVSLEQRFNSLIDRYQAKMSLEFSETFKRQLRASPTFHDTAIEATRLTLEALAFDSLPHTDEERDSFRKSWQARAEKFAERVAEGDPLAVEVILKAIEKESVRPGR